MVDEATMMEKRQSSGEWLIAVIALHQKYVNLTLQPSAMRLYHAAVWNSCPVGNNLYELTVLLGTDCMETQGNCLRFW
jgi:hypothetical protein